MTSRKEKAESRGAILAPYIAAGTRKTCADIRESLQDARKAKALHLAPATHHAMLQAADQVDVLLLNVAQESADKASVNAAALNLQKAAARLGAVANAPEDWAGLALVFEAKEHIGVARLQVGEPQRVKQNMTAIARVSRKLVESDRTQILRVYAARLSAGTKRGAIKCLALDFKVSEPTIRAVLEIGKENSQVAALLAKTLAAREGSSRFK